MKNRIGIGSYAFRNSIASGQMDAFDLVRTSSKLGASAVALYENLPYTDYSNDQLMQLKELGDSFDISFEVGTRGLSAEHILRHLEIADILGAKLLRLVIGHGGTLYQEKSPELKTQTIKVLSGLLPALREMDITIGIENHFDLPSADLSEIVQGLNDRHIGLIYDTTNGLGLAEKPLDTLEIMAPYLLSVHLKDYCCKKADGGYLIYGVDLGTGNLDISQILKRALESNPAISITVEFNIILPAEINDLYCWEYERVSKNLNEVSTLMHRLHP